MKAVLVPGFVAAGLLMAAAVSAFGAGSNPAPAVGPAGPGAVQQPAEDPGQGARRHASAIAEEFGVSEDEVLQFHKDGLGFGALFKVYKLARAKGVSASSLVASFPQVNGEPDPDFGAQFGGLTDDQRARLKDGPKNLGKLISGQAKKR